MSQTRTFGYSFNDSSRRAGGARGVNTQALTRQKDLHNIFGGGERATTACEVRDGGERKTRREPWESFLDMTAHCGSLKPLNRREIHKYYCQAAAAAAWEQRVCVTDRITTEWGLREVLVIMQLEDKKTALCTECHPALKR